MSRHSLGLVVKNLLFTIVVPGTVAFYLLSLQKQRASVPRQPTTAEAAASDFITAGTISQLAVDTYVKESLAADPVRVDWYRRHEWMALDPVAVTVPTLLIHGEFDPYAPIERQMMFFALLGTSDKQWVVVPGGDHAALLETSRAYFLSAVVGFIERPR